MCLVLFVCHFYQHHFPYRLSPYRKSRPSLSVEFTTVKMSAAIASLVSYGSDSDSENEAESTATPEKVEAASPDATAHLRPLKTGPTMTLAVLNSAPEVAVKVS